MAQAQSWASPLVLGAMLVALKARHERHPRRRWIASAGALCGAAALLKFPSVLPALPVVALALGPTVGDPPRRATARAVPDLAAFIVAGGAPLILAAGWLWAGHALGAHLDVDRGFLVPYTHLNAPSLGQRVASIFGYTL